MSEYSEINKLFNKLDKLDDIVDNKVMTNIGINLVYNIKKRTLAGIDKNNTGFQSYSPSYQKFKRNKGHSGGVNLFFNGTMSRSMIFNANALETRLFFGSLKESIKAERHSKGLNGMPRREFFALSQNDKQDITNAISNTVLSKIRRIK